jgi:hypothetical protein
MRPRGTRRREFPDRVFRSELLQIIVGPLVGPGDGPAAVWTTHCAAVLDPQSDVVGQLTAQMPPMFDEYVDMMFAGTYESTSLRLATGAENLQAIVDFGRSNGVDTGLFESVLQMLNASATAGDGTNLAAVFEAVKQQPG